MDTSKFLDPYISKWKVFCEGLAAGRIASTYILSQMISFPNHDRYQIDGDTFLKCLANPAKPIGNVLILQGGVRHMDTRSYYVRTACSLIPSNIRVFLYEKIPPMVNFDYAHDVAKCLDYIRTHFPGPIVVVGYSMGGILLYNYLSLGYDQADLYVPTCCPLDLRNFQQTIQEHSLFQYLQDKAYRQFQVKDFEGLLKLAGSDCEKHENLIRNFIPGLNQNSQKWVPKTVYVISTDDPLTRNYCSELKLLKDPPLTYRVQGGWHCCLNSIFLSVQLAYHYLQDRQKGKCPQPDQIKVH